MAITAVKPTTGAMNWRKSATAAGPPIIVGGVKMIIAGTPSATGMTTTTIRRQNEVRTKETTNRVHPING